LLSCSRDGRWEFLGPGGQVYWTANAPRRRVAPRPADRRQWCRHQPGLRSPDRALEDDAGRHQHQLHRGELLLYVRHARQRAHANENNLTETFTYDVLNRVTSATVSQNIAPVKSFAFDVIGNLLSKSDVGTYTYPASGANAVRPHAVTSISGSTINTTFAHDPNGNQTSGLGRTINCTSFNKPSAISNGSSTLNFSHDIDHQRFKQQTALEGGRQHSTSVRSEFMPS
jgi:hypothetical protein